MFQPHRVLAKQPNSKMCYVCGLSNSPGLQAQFFELDSEQIVGIFTPTDHMQGYPGRLHGGVASSMLDETIGRAIRITHGDELWGVTIELRMRFRKPVPLGEPIQTVARVTKESRRHFEGLGEILLPSGRVAIEAHGRYLKLPIDSISDFDYDEQHWHVVPTDADPEFIELPKRVGLNNVENGSPPELDD